MITTIQMTADGPSQYAIVLPESATAETVKEMHHALHHLLQIVLGNGEAMQNVTVQTGYNIMQLLGCFISDAE